MSSFCNVPFFRLDDLLMEIETAIRIHGYNVEFVRKIDNFDPVCSFRPPVPSFRCRPGVNYQFCGAPFGLSLTHASLIDTRNH